MPKSFQAGGGKKKGLKIVVKPRTASLGGPCHPPGPDPPRSLLASVLELGRKQEAAEKKTNTINLLKFPISLTNY